MAPKPSDTIESVRQGIKNLKARAKPVVEEASRTKKEVSELFDDVGVDRRDGGDEDLSGLRSEVGEFVGEGRDVLAEMDDLGLEDEPFREPFVDTVDGAGEVLRDASENGVGMDEELREEVREDELRSLQREAKRDALRERRERLREELVDEEEERLRQRLDLDGEDDGRGERSRRRVQDDRRREDAAEENRGVFDEDDGLGDGGIWGEAGDDRDEGRGGAFPEDEGIWG